MSEMKTLTLNGKTYDSFVDKEARKALENLEPGGGIATVEPADDDIPKVYFTGTLPTGKGEGDVQLTMHYISKTADFAHPVTLKVQGSSSVNYPKKNFTLKLYEDSTYESKKKLAFKNWPEMNKFVLKAHWMDHSHVRNVGSAKIWGKIVKSRSDYDALPEELRNAPNNGATDGFTCKVFCNGVYQGLYEWIVAKDKLFGQDSDNVKHSILNSEWNNQPTCAFATTAPSINGNWSEELLDSMTADTKTSMENWIKFVAGSSDEYFVANAENYFDVQSVIDADIFDRVFCTVDNLCRNQIVFKYDSKWYIGKWDLDAVLGLPPMASQQFFAYDTEYQKGYVAYKDYGITNLLYQRVETLFMDRFKARYAELRSSVLTIENILDVYERLTDTIKTYDGLLEEDYASTTGGGAFTGIPHKTENNIQQIRAFVSQRIPYMDDVVENMSIIPDEPDVPDEPDEPDVPDDTVVAEDFDSSTWTANYYNDDGVLTEHSGMYHSQLIPIDLGDEDVSRKTVISGSVQYLRVSYFDADYKFVGFVLKNPIEISPPDGAVYYAVNAMTANKSDVIITVTEYELNGNLMDGVGWHYGSVHGGTGAAIGGKTDIISDAFDISGYAGDTLTIDVEGTIGITGQKLIYYGADGTFIGAGYDKSYQGTTNPFDVVIPTNAVTAKAGMLATATTFRLYYNDIKIAESTPTEIQ